MIVALPVKLAQVMLQTFYLFAVFAVKQNYIDLPFREERAHLPIAKFIDFLKMRPEEIDLFSCQVNPIVHCTTTPTPGKHLNAILINCKCLDYDFFVEKLN